jgi:hypothetical protein
MAQLFIHWVKVDVWTEAPSGDHPEPVGPHQLLDRLRLT